MKISEITEGAVYRKQLNHADLEAKLAQYNNMTPREQRENYKPFGRLGKLTSPEQVLYHTVDGSREHDWSFDLEVAEFTQFMCTVCGKVNKVRRKQRR